MDYQILLIIAVPAAIVHVMEEYKFGWVAWANNIISGITVKQFMWVNALFLTICIAAAVSSTRYPLFSSSIFSLLLINFLIHFMPTLIQKKYSPGLFSAVFLFLPIGVIGYQNLLAQRLISSGELMISVALGFLWMSVPFIYQAIRSAHARNAQPFRCL